jgi:hypothetical protein
MAALGPDRAFALLQPVGEIEIRKVASISAVGACPKSTGTFLNVPHRRSDHFSKDANVVGLAPKE